VGRSNIGELVAPRPLFTKSPGARVARNQSLSALSLLLNSKLHIAGAIFGLMVTGPSAPAQTPGSQKPVFVHANCDGKAAATVLGSLKEEMTASGRYVVIPRLDDSGNADDVFEIYMDCTQRDNVVAVATSYGKGRCLSKNKCVSMVDGGSIKSTLCDGHAAGECGKTLFASFEEYVSRQKRTSTVAAELTSQFSGGCRVHRVWSLSATLVRET